MALTPAESEQLAALQAKAAVPDVADPGEPADVVAVAGETAGEVGAAVAGAVADVAATVAATVAAVVNDARSEEADRLEREVAHARVDAAVAEMHAEDAELVTARAEDVIDALTEPVPDAELTGEVTAADAVLEGEEFDQAPDDVVPPATGPAYFTKRVGLPAWLTGRGAR